MEVIIVISVMLVVRLVRDVMLGHGIETTVV